MIKDEIDSFPTGNDYDSLGLEDELTSGSENNDWLGDRLYIEKEDGSGDRLFVKEEHGINH